MENQYYSIKINLSDERESVFILFTVLFKISDRKTTSFGVVASSYPITTEVHTNATHKDYLNKTIFFQKTSEFLKERTTKLENYLQKSLFTENFTEEVIHYLTHEQTDNVQNLFLRIFQNQTGLKNLQIEMDVETLHESEMDRMSMSITEPESFTETAPTKEETIPEITEIPPDAKIASFKFVVSPISGKIVNDLAIGDEVYIRLDPSNEESTSLIHSMNLKDENGEIQPIVATVIANRKQGTSFLVAVKINEFVYGKVTEEEKTVRIKTVASDQASAKMSIDPAHIKKEKTPSATPARADLEFNPGGLLQLAIIVIILLLVVIAIFKLIV